MAWAFLAIFWCCNAVGDSVSGAVPRRVIVAATRENGIVSVVLPGEGARPGPRIYRVRDGADLDPLEPRGGVRFNPASDPRSFAGRVYWVNAPAPRAGSRHFAVHVLPAKAWAGPGRGPAPPGGGWLPETDLVSAAGVPAAPAWPQAQLAADMPPIADFPAPFSRLAARGSEPCARELAEWIRVRAIDGVASRATAAWALQEAGRPGPQPVVWVDLLPRETGDVLIVACVNYALAAVDYHTGTPEHSAVTGHRSVRFSRRWVLGVDFYQPFRVFDTPKGPTYVVTASGGVHKLDFRGPEAGARKIWTAPGDGPVVLLTDNDSGAGWVFTDTWYLPLTPGAAPINRAAPAAPSGVLDTLRRYARDLDVAPR